MLSSLTDVSVDDGLLWPRLRHDLTPETKIGSKGSTETKHKLLEKVKTDMGRLHLRRNLGTIAFVSLPTLMST